MFRLCSEKEIPVSQLKSTAAVCLLIATKWNEKEDKVPMLRDLAAYCSAAHGGTPAI